MRQIQGRSYGSQPEAPARDIAEHVTLRIPQAVVVQLRQVMRRQKMTRTEAILFCVERGLTKGD